MKLTDKHPMKPLFNKEKRSFWPISKKYALKREIYSKNRANKQKIGPVYVFFGLSDVKINHEEVPV